MNFKKMLEKWAEEKVISSEQFKKMLVDLEQETTDKNSSRMIGIVSTIGGILLGLGAILFIASNWEMFPKTIKLILAVLLPVIPAVIAYILIYIKKTHQILGYSLVMLSSLLIGATIAIIGQVYNTDANPRAMFGIWSLISIPLIYIFVSKSAAAVTTILTGIWLFFLLVGGTQIWDWEDSIQYFPQIYIGYGVILLLLAEWHQNYFQKVYQSIGEIYKTIAVKIILTAGFILTLGIYNEYIIYEGEAIFGSASRIIYNILFVGLLAFLFYWGVKKSDKILVNSAVFWLGAYIISLYFDFFWKMFNISLFFMVGGILLVGLAIFLEKKRRQLVTSFQENLIINLN